MWVLAGEQNDAVGVGEGGVHGRLNAVEVVHRVSACEEVSEERGWGWVRCRSAE